MCKKCYAAIDIGSNAVRLLIKKEEENEEDPNSKKKKKATRFELLFFDLLSKSKFCNDCSVTIDIFTLKII